MLTKQYINTKCLTLACKKLGIKYSIYDQNGNFVVVFPRNKAPQFFINSRTPFNNSSIEKLCKDKDFSYKLLKNDIQMPKTLAFFNPTYVGKFKQYRTHKNIKSIIDEIESKLEYPMIIKMNAGRQGINVFKSKNRAKTRYSLKKIFNRKILNNDHVALAQEYIKIKKEYRAVFLKQKLILLYEKDFNRAKTTRNLSPLHRINAKAKLISDREIKNRIEKFVALIFKKLPIKFVGLDIAIDRKQKMFLLELNTNLGFEYFVRDNGEEALIQMYIKILKNLD